MSIKSIDTLLALKVLNFASGLTSNDRRVGAVLLEHFNRKTARCDPGLERVANLLGISVRTVIRCNHRLERAGLFRRIRHGSSFGNRNCYIPNWQRFAELEQAWRSQFNRRPNSSATKSSPALRQDCHLHRDSTVTQTCITNLPKLTCSSGLPKKGSAAHSPTAPARVSGKPARDAARDAADGRWLRDVGEKYQQFPTTYSELIEAITDQIQTRATDAELQRRGAGLIYVETQLKLRP
jgi:hypothetical protein